MLPIRYALLLTLLACFGSYGSAQAQSIHSSPASSTVGSDGDEAPTTLARGGGGGFIDVTFGDGGTSTFPASVVSDLIFQPDGKILTSGRIDGDAAVVRLNSDGSFDESFGTDGIATVDLGGTLDTFLSLAIQDDGKIVAAGSVLFNEEGDGDGAALARLHPDGALDMSFDADGILLEPGTPESGTPDAFWHVAVRPTGHIIAGGPQGAYRTSGEASACYAAQYLPNGDRDASFGTGGIVSALSGEDVFCLDGALMDDGRYVLGVNVALSSNLLLWGAVRLLPDGSPDTSFDEDGLALMPGSAAAFSFHEAMSVGPDGSTTHGVTPPFAVPTPSLVRFSADGDVDVSFGAGLNIFLTEISPGYIWDITLQPDGRALLVGSLELESGAVVPFLARTDVDGALDDGFGETGEGFTRIDFGTSPSSNGGGWSVQLDSENRIVVAGILDSNAAPSEGFVARFDNDLMVATEPLALAQRIALDTPFPNPVDRRSTLPFSLSDAADIHLALYDVLGREVALLAEGAHPAGRHEVALDVSRLKSGLYVARLTTASEVATRRLTIVR